MVALLSSLPDPPPDQGSSPQPPTSCRGLWAEEAGNEEHRQIPQRVFCL